MAFYKREWFWFLFFLLLLLFSFIYFYFFSKFALDFSLKNYLDNYIDLPNDYARVIQGHDERKSSPRSTSRPIQPRIFYYWQTEDGWVYRASMTYYKTTLFRDPLFLSKDNVKDLQIEIFPYPKKVFNSYTTFDDDDLYWMNIGGRNGEDAEDLGIRDSQSAIELSKKLTKIKEPEVISTTPIVREGSEEIFNRTDLDLANCAYDGVGCGAWGECRDGKRAQECGVDFSCPNNLGLVTKELFIAYRECIPTIPKQSVEGFGTVKKELGVTAYNVKGSNFMLEVNVMQGYVSLKV